jgi:hypothetical protein
VVTFQIPYRKLGVITGRYKEESFVAKPGRLKMEVHNEKPIEIFFSYARKDERLMSELEKHLHIMQRQGLITGWHDNKISPGEEWEQETTVHLNRADIILLLISPDFMASEYCYSGTRLDVSGSTTPPGHSSTACPAGSSPLHHG